jgi:hypothetical protein
VKRWARVGIRYEILGMLVEFQKAAVGFVMSVRLGQLGSHWTDFHEV